MRKVTPLFLGCILLLGCASVFAQGDKKKNEKPAAVNVNIRDYCDPATFGNLCSRTNLTDGAITFQGLLDEVGVDKSVGAWRFVPDQVKSEEGAVISFKNLGGETHTFTRVKKFGGGFVDFLNAPSGNPVPAPECAQMVNGNLVPAPGLVMTPAGGTGQVTVKDGKEATFQCCIHPWMRFTVKADEHHGHHD